MARAAAAAAVLVVAVALVVSEQPPGSRAGWVWGRRSTGGPALGNLPQQSVLHRRRGRLVRPANRHVTPFFKSIGARVTAPTPTPFNALNTFKEDEKHTSASIQPSPIDTFVSHFDVYDHKNTNSFPEDIKKVAQEFETEGPSITPSLITLGEYPFPFASKPIDLGDGTSIGWVKEDTLLVKNNDPAIVKKPTQQKLKHPAISDEHDARYTTLDKLLDSREPTLLPDTHSLPNDVLGGLHPDEVFYADKDIVIIKGGGFTTKQTINTNDLNNGIGRATSQSGIKPSGNGINDYKHIKLINVRPDEKFASVPLPLRFLNGNIPTILKSSSSPQTSRLSNRNLRRKLSHGFRPTHQESFMPIDPQRLHHPFLTSSSDQIQSYSTLPTGTESLSVNPTGNYQRLDDEESMVAMPSVQRYSSVLPPVKLSVTPSVTLTVPPPVKRSTKSKVVQYHYQTRGNNRPIVDYKIHKNGEIERHTTDFSKPPALLNKIQVSAKESIEDGKLPKKQETDENFADLEDFSVTDVQSFIPKTQVPKKRPSSAYPIRLRPTFPSITPQWVYPRLSTARPSFKPSIQLPPNYKPARPPHSSNGNVSHKHKPMSLIGDTRVNFLLPRPPINHQAEFLLRQPTVIPLNSINGPPSLLSTRGIPHVPFLIRSEQPQVLHQLPTLRPNAPQGRQRFREPRRKHPFRLRQAPRV